MAQTAIFDAYRTLANGSITSSFVAIGTPFLHLLRAIRIVNNTDGDMIFSTDASTLMMFVPKGTFVLWDVTANKEVAGNLYIPKGTQFWVKYSSAPSTGSVYVEGVYAIGE